MVLSIQLYIHACERSPIKNGKKTRLTNWKFDFPNEYTKCFCFVSCFFFFFEFLIASSIWYKRKRKRRKHDAITIFCLFVFHMGEGKRSFEWSVKNVCTFWMENILLRSTKLSSVHLISMGILLLPRRLHIFNLIYESHHRSLFYPPNYYYQRVEREFQIVVQTKEWMRKKYKKKKKNLNVICVCTCKKRGILSSSFTWRIPVWVQFRKNI